MASYIIKALIRYQINSCLQGLLVTGPIAGAVLTINDLNADAAWQTALLIIGIGTLLQMVVGLYNFMKWAKPFRTMELFIRELESGNLTAEVNIKDLGGLARVAEPMQDLRDKWNDILLQIRGANTDVRQSVAGLDTQAIHSETLITQINTNMTATRHATTEQLEATAQCATSIEEMTLGVQRIAESTSIVSELSCSTTEQAQQGQRSLQHVIEQMHAISATVTNLARDLHALTERSSAIGQIIEVMRGIAAQTNLLALNASIEAARAGEHGKGFAVVAAEVGKLAAQSTASAEQIVELIEQTQTHSQRVTATMNDGVHKVETGLALVDTMHHYFSSILQAVEQISDQMKDISASSQQVAATSRTLSERMTDVSQLADNTYRQAEDNTAAAKQELDAIATISETTAHVGQLVDKLDDMLGHFRLR